MSFQHFSIYLSSKDYYLLKNKFPEKRLYITRDISAGGSFRPITLPLKLPGPDELAALPKGAVVMLHGGVLDRNLDTSYLKQESKDLRWSGDIPSAYPTG